MSDNESVNDSASEHSEVELDEFDEIEEGEEVAPDGAPEEEQQAMADVSDSIESIKIVQLQPSNIDLIVGEDEQRTSNFLSHPELTAAISRRARDIEKNNSAMVRIDNQTDAIEIARQELRQRKFPYLLSRQVGHQIRDGKIYKIYEYLDINKMSFTL